MTLIEVRPHHRGWKVFEAPGVAPVFQRNARQSITLSVVRVSVPVKFVFWTLPARSNAPSRLTRRIEGRELRVKTGN